MTAHTPGPWDRFNEHPTSNIFIESSHHGSVCKVAKNARSDANARLIAAAPTLLEALEAIKTTILEDRRFMRDRVREVLIWAEIAIRLAKEGK